MSKRVIVIASGETERRSLPHLVAHLRAEDIYVVEVRRPDGNKALNVEMAEKLVKAAWYAPTDSLTPDKFVILVDTDAKDPDQVLRPFREQLPGRLGARIKATVQFAYAQRHLEAWYFADFDNLRKCLGGRDLGSVDASQPDKIQDPKRHLKNLLEDRAYTAVVSEQIASKLKAEAIADRSASFRRFLEAVRNGSVGTGVSGTA
ncbi:MAG: DUF4276 family protein [Pirellulales bacterium]